MGAPSFSIIGSRGFIGSQLVRHLTRVGDEIFCPARDTAPPYGRSLGHVLYCAGVTADFRERPFAAMESHVSVLSAVLERERFDSLTYLSSTKVYGRSETTGEGTACVVRPEDPEDLYRLSKLAGEALCLQSGKAVRIARLSNVFGAGASASFLSTILEAALNGGAVTLQSTADSAKDYVSVTDVVTLLRRIALEGTERIYNVASGTNVVNAVLMDAVQRETRCTWTVAPTAARLVHTPIDIGRVRTEFRFEPIELLRELPALVRELRRVSESPTARR